MISKLIATPYSTLLTNKAFFDSVSSLTDIFEIREPQIGFYYGSNVLWHCELSLCSVWSETEIDYLTNGLEILRDNGAGLDGISFHLASRYQDNKIIDGKFVGENTAMSETELHDNVRLNLNQVFSLFGNSLEVLVENNNHLGTDAYDVVTSPHFIKDVLQENNVFLLLDIAHARITAGNTRSCEKAYFNALPLKKVRQIHLSRHSEVGGEFHDSHNHLLSDDWDFFRHISSISPNLKYVTIEYYKDQETLLMLLQELKKILSTN